MAHQMTMILTDEEYQKLVTTATKSGTNPETLLREMIERLPSLIEKQHPLTERELAEKLYHEGKLTTLATPYTLPRRTKLKERVLLVCSLAINLHPIWLLRIGDHISDYLLSGYLGTHQEVHSRKNY